MIRAPQSVGVVRLLEAGEPLPAATRHLGNEGECGPSSRGPWASRHFSAGTGGSIQGKFEDDRAVRTWFEPASESILQALKLSLEAAGIDFIPENGGGPGVRLSRGAANT